jgi:hypothetical protein
MPYHLPTAFVANDYLCEFLLAQGLVETTDAASPDGPRHFHKETAAGQPPLRIELNLAATTIEVYQLPDIGGTYTSLPAAALVLLLTTQPCPQQASFFHQLLQALGGAHPRSEHWGR